VLNYIHGAGAVPSVMQALHDACGDDGAFLRVLYRLPDGTGTPVDQKRDAPSPVKSPPDPAIRIEPAAPRTEDRRVSLPQFLPTWFGRRGVLVSIVVVAIVAGSAVWILRSPKQTQTAERLSQPAGGAPSLLTAPSKGPNPNNAAAPPAQSSNNQLIRPAQPLIKGSTQLIK